MAFDFKGRNLKVVVRSLSVVDLSGNDARSVSTMGILTAQTDVTVIRDETSKIKLKASGKKLDQSHSTRVCCCMLLGVQKANDFSFEFSALFGIIVS